MLLVGLRGWDERAEESVFAILEEGNLFGEDKVFVLVEEGVSVVSRVNER
jgi:hypothetical protein